MIEDAEKPERKRWRKPSPTPKGASARKRYTPQEKEKLVRLYMDKKIPVRRICAQAKVDKGSLYEWIKEYKQQGVGGRRPAEPRSAAKRLPAAVLQKIVELKQAQPSFGIKRIADHLRRFFFLKASPETVRQTLHQAQLMNHKRPKARRNMTRPRFFERATPNQMWQSDIFTFRLGGRYAYVVAFLDDYSRYVVGIALFRSATANAVIEVYRQASAQFGAPKEMLTDQGRQYASWRGTSRFAAEMKKDRVAHILSRPHHPMTLGKVERFWSTLWQEFLERAQFASFEQAQERIRQWTTHYNHQRTHQGLEGLCPADRFFALAQELRQTIEAGIEENLKELALRGRPQEPFYMVGQMGGQSVVLRAEKGLIKWSVTDAQKQSTQELTHELEKGTTITHTDIPSTQEPAPGLSAENLHRDGEGAGGAGGMDGTVQAGGCLPSDERELDRVQPVADPRDGGNAPSSGEPGEPLAGGSALPAPASALGEAAAVAGSVQAEPEARAVAAENKGSTTGAGNGMMQSHGNASSSDALTDADTTDQTQSQAQADGPQERIDPPSLERPDHGDRSGRGAGHVPEDLLPVGEEASPGNNDGHGTQAPGPSQPGARPPSRGLAETGQGTGTRGGNGSAGPSNPGSPGCDAGGEK